MYEPELPLPPLIYQHLCHEVFAVLPQNLFDVLSSPAAIFWLELSVLFKPPRVFLLQKHEFVNWFLTSHLGDSGIINRPSSNTEVGIRPTIANT